MILYECEDVSFSCAIEIIIGVNQPRFSFVSFWSLLAFVHISFVEIFFACHHFAPK